MKTTAARREQLLDEYELSGLSGTKFAAMAGVKYQTFALWAQRRRQQRGSRDGSLWRSHQDRLAEDMGMSFPTS